jgi:hypothetical protein
MFLSRLKKWECALAVACFAPLLVHAAPQTGWWWSPAESGRMYFIETLDDNVLLIGTYLYDSDGRATWLVSAGSMANEDAYAGRLARISGGQTLTGEYRSPTAIEDAGPLSLEFTYDDVGTLTGPGGTIPIEPFHFDSTAPSFLPYAGGWWNDAESGSGYNIVVEGESLFMIASMYDEDGRPVWYSTTGKMTSPTLYQGTLQQFANGQTLTGEYRPPDMPPTDVGQVTIDFSAEDVATLTISQNIPDAKKAKSIEVQPLKKKVPLASLPRGWQGTYQLDATSHVQDGGDTTDVKDIFQGSIEWGEPGDSELPPLPLPGGKKWYLPITMSLTVTSTLKQTSTDGGHCEGDGTGKTSTPLGGSLELDRRGQYFGELSALVNFQMMRTCVTSDGKVDGPKPIPTTGIFFLYFSGKQVYGMNGHPAPTSVNYGISKATAKRSWNFNAVR